MLGKLADAGVTAAGSTDVDDGPLYLWPECEAAWQAFMDLRDQWREGVLPRADVVAHLREVYPEDDERREVYEGVCACSHAVTAVHREHRARLRQQG